MEPFTKHFFRKRILQFRYLPHICFLYLLFLILSSAFRFLPPPDIFLSESERFAQFSEEVFRNELSGNTLNMHYTLADPSSWDLEEAPISLGSHAPENIRNSWADLENYKSMLQTFDYEKLTAKQQQTYDIFLEYLEAELQTTDLYLYDEPLSPTLGIQAQLPVLLAEYEFRTKGDIEDYLSLLSQIPDYFDSILEYESEKSANGLFMSTDCALEVIKQCRDFIENPSQNYLLEIFNEKIDEIKNLTTDEKTAFKTRNASILHGYVIPAYETLIQGIGTLEGSGVNEKGLYWLPKGQRYYEHLVKQTTGDHRPVSEIEEHIKTQMIADFKAIQSLTQKSTEKDTETEKTTASETAVNGIAAASAPSAMLQELKNRIRTDFPVLPDVSCEIRYVHLSLQNHLSPAFYLTPAIDDYQNNVIYINPASNYQDLELFTTLAHEGYPGHLYQSVYFCTTQPDLLRNILSVGGYTEGWATYVEMYAHTLWDKNPQQAVLSQKNRSFTLGLASLLDIGIHYHGYSLDDVIDFLAKLGFENSTAESLYHSILQSPANYLQYYVGYLNFCSLRDEMQELFPKQFTLKNFHQYVLEAGPAPFHLLKEYLQEAYASSEIY